MRSDAHDLTQRAFLSLHWVPELGGGVMGYCESMFPNLFNSSFPISVLYPGAVISHQESLSISKVFLCMDNCPS